MKPTKTRTTTGGKSSDRDGSAAPTSEDAAVTIAEPAQPVTAQGSEGESGDPGVDDANEAGQTGATEDVFDPLHEFFVSDAERARMARSFGVSGALAAAGAGLRSGSGSANASGMVELLAFWVAGEEYALSIVQIQEIIKLQPITELPRAHRSVLGVISLRGTVVPVLDLRHVLHLEERPMSRQTRILVVRSDEDPVGLLVDRVTSVVRFEADKIEATPRAMRRQTSELVRGVGRLGNRLIIVLEVGSVIAALDAAA